VAIHAFSRRSRKFFCSLEKGFKKDAGARLSNQFPVVEKEGEPRKESPTAKGAPRR
jgi:hypothetical protein